MAVTTESRTSPRTEPRVEKGVSLARGPALILGTILLAAGLYFIYKQHTFQKLSNFPNGTATVQGKVLFGLFGGDGWTGMLTAICGGLLLFGAAQHHLAKTMSLIVGVVLGAAAIIGLVDHGNVLGLASANHLTELAWGIAAAILLVNTLIPRRTRTIEPAYDDRAYDDRAGERRGGGGRVAAGAAAGAGAGAVAEHEHDRHRERRADQRVAEDGNGAQAGAGAPAGDRGAAAAAPAGDRGAGAGEPVGDRGAGRQTAGGPAATNRADDATSVQQRGTTGARQDGQGGGQVGLAERARRWLRPGSEN
ncbi:MAG TPA: hypothetical protein VGG87_01565 [Solirubrobacteraceae bacterium]